MQCNACPQARAWLLLADCWALAGCLGVGWELALSARCLAALPRSLAAGSRAHSLAHSLTLGATHDSRSSSLSFVSLLSAFSTTGSEYTNPILPCPVLTRRKCRSS